MKNFPHQYSDTAKIRAALEVIRDLNDAGEDVGDDGVLGEELARKGVHNLLGSGTVAQRLAAERAKPPSSQGFRTAAREMRKTFLHLGWLDEQHELTSGGDELLARGPGDTEERDLWRQALLNLTVTDDDGNTSHPARLLLRLVADHPFDGRDGLELALEAKDDTDSEFRRVIGLSRLTKAQRLRGLGISEAKAENAKKILPALAEQAGLIERQSLQHSYTLTEAGKAAIGAVLEGGSAYPRVVPRTRPRASGRTRRGVRRRVTPGTVARRRTVPQQARRTLSPEEQAAADRLLYERTDRHQALVRRLAGRLPSQLSLFEDTASYDLVADPTGSAPLFLFEIKTLESDDVTQVRLAAGQLLYYRDVVIPTQWPKRQVRPVAGFEGAIDPVLATFLDGLGIGAIAIRPEGFKVLNGAGRSALQELGL